MKTLLIFAALLLTASCATPPPPSEQVFYYEIATNKPYDEVLSELQAAIAEHNFRITAHSRVGKVIRERGAANFPEYDTIQFCNLTLAKTVLDISPQAIGFMPCNVVTYQFDKQTRIKTHLLPENTDSAPLNQFAADMNRQLKQIVDEAAKN
jgi:uncharacterized protein (DUF302 family)